MFKLNFFRNLVILTLTYPWEYRYVVANLSMPKSGQVPGYPLTSSSLLILHINTLHQLFLFACFSAQSNPQLTEVWEAWDRITQVGSTKLL